MRDLVKAIVMVSAVCYMAYAENACSTKDSSNVNNPLEVIGPYFQSSDLIEPYLSKFNTVPSLVEYFKIAKKGSTDAHPIANLLGWQIAMFSSIFLDKTYEDLCEVPSLTRQAVAYEQSGDKNALRCVITFLAENTRRTVSDVVEITMEDAGCSGVYRKPVRPVPSCFYETCEASDNTLWNGVYQAIDKTFKEVGIPVFPETYDVLDTLFKSNVVNDQRAAGMWNNVVYHTALLEKYGIAEDPIVYNLVAKFVSFMEQIAFSKECSCADRNEVLSKAEEEISVGIDSEVELWEKTISE